jgi:predicted naringenin-chalcone synthase
VPDALAEHVRDATRALLDRHGLGLGDVAAWAVHPGGPRIVDVVAERLELEEAAVASSREALAKHGNCSSATVLLILDEILAGDDLAPGDAVVAMAFGPGLTLYAALLRAV